MYSVRAGALFYFPVGNFLLLTKTEWFSPNVWSKYEQRFIEFRQNLSCALIDSKIVSWDLLWPVVKVIMHISLFGQDIYNLIIANGGNICGSGSRSGTFKAGAGAVEVTQKWPSSCYLRGWRWQTHQCYNYALSICQILCDLIMYILLGWMDLLHPVMPSSAPDAAFANNKHFGKWYTYMRVGGLGGLDPPESEIKRGQLQKSG